MNKIAIGTALVVVQIMLVSCLELPGGGEQLRERVLVNLNENWAYYETNVKGPEALNSLNATASIDLPHTWNQWDATDNLPGYRRDAGWYRRTVNFPDHGDARYLLFFEGANISTEVYVNGEKAGAHVGGYVGFEIDVTPFVEKGADNDIAIRVDNGYDPEVIPSQKSDFFIYGGITRDLWLKVVPVTHIRQLLVSTPAVSRNSADTRLDVSIEGIDAISGEVTLQAVLTDPDQKEVVSASKKIDLTGSSTTSSSWNLPELVHPALWSPDTPHLYELHLTLLADGKPVDVVSTTVGYRWFDFTPNGPFLLNGERLLIRGTHRHEEHAGYGAAMPNELHRKDMEMIKEMGANFVRLGHYPQDPEIYRACDELGLIVWDELPWCRGGVGNDVWAANAMRLFTEQIHQNYNHPSIFFWSVGNEIYWLPDFADGGDTAAINRSVTALHELAHELDPGRLTALRKYYEGAHLVDVFSPSIWSGWYAGVYKNYETALEKSRSQYPRLLHMEYGGSSHVGRHTETPITGDGLVNPDDWTEAVNQAGVRNIAKSGDWTENYIVDLFDWHLRTSESSDWFPGNAQWAFKDFGTPLRPENSIPYINQKGLVDRAGNPKDAYYVFKSYWSKSPFAYIESHTWTERAGPEGKAREINVFSNAERVTLIHNGQSLDTKDRDIQAFPAAGLHWDVQFTEGKNELIALAYQGEKLTASDTLTVSYSYEKPGQPSEIVMNSRSLPNGNYLVEAVMVDAKGNRVLDYEDRVYFDCNGNGELLQNYGTPTRSGVIEMANGRAAIELKPQTGRITIEARNQDFKGSYLVIDAAAKK